MSELMRMPSVGPFQGGDARHLVEGGFRGGIRRRARPRCGHVLRADDHDAPAARRSFEQRVRTHQLRLASTLTRITRCHSSVAMASMRSGEDARVQHQHVQAAERFTDASRAAAIAPGSVTSQRSRESPGSTVLVSDRGIEVEADDRRAPREQSLGAGLADAGRGAGDQRHLAREQGGATASATSPARDPSTRRRIMRRARAR